VLRQSGADASCANEPFGPVNGPEDDPDPGGAPASPQASRRAHGLGQSSPIDGPLDLDSVRSRTGPPGAEGAADSPARVTTSAWRSDRCPLPRTCCAVILDRRGTEAQSPIHLLSGKLHATSGDLSPESAPFSCRTILEDAWRFDFGRHTPRASYGCGPAPTFGRLKERVIAALDQRKPKRPSLPPRYRRSVRALRPAGGAPSAPAGRTIPGTVAHVCL
jgi:hypothetical protein